jgi:hypothetical protein
MPREFGTSPKHHKEFRMKFCFTLLATIALAVWTVGCGSQDTTTSDTGVDTNTDLGAPGGMEGGTTTPGMDSPDEDTGEGATGGPELP